MAKLRHNDPAMKIILASDFSQLSNGQGMKRTGLMQIVQQTTCGQSVCLCGVRNVQHSLSGHVGCAK